MYRMHARSLIFKVNFQEKKVWQIPGIHRGTEFRLTAVHLTESQVHLDLCPYKITSFRENYGQNLIKPVEVVKKETKKCYIDHFYVASHF